MRPRMAERLFLRLDGDPLYAPETGAPAGAMREFAVAPSLGGHVASIASCREVVPEGHEVEERVLPDGALRLVFHFGERPQVDGVAGSRAAVVGASAAPVLLRLRGRMDGLSVTLKPGAAEALLGLPAGELKGSGVALDDLWGSAGRTFCDRLAELGDDAARIRLLQQVLQDRLRTEESAVRRQAWQAARLIAESGGRRPLREVADTLGVGERRLQQIFHAHVGLSPRAWSRLARLHGLLRALRGERSPRWADIAVDAGFYDQSHLANEFRSLCGLTPSAFLARSVAGSSKTTS